MKHKGLLSLLAISSSVLLLAACSDEETEEAEKRYGNEGKEVVLKEKQEMLNGRIVYKDKNILYIADNNSMIKVGVRIDGSENMSEDEINKVMLDYPEGVEINVRSNAYTDGRVKEMYVDKEDIKLGKDKKENGSAITVSDAYSRALAYIYTLNDMNNIEHLYVVDHTYDKENALWTVYVNFKLKDSEGRNSLEVPVDDVDIMY